MKIKTKAVVILTSTAPALQNQMRIATLEEIGGKRPATQRRTDISDVDAAKPKLYLDSEGKMGWPALNFGAALCEAGKHIQVKLGNAKKAAALTKSSGRSVIPTMVELSRPFYPFSAADEKGQIHWDANAARTVNPATQGSNRTVRPLIPAWQCEVEFVFTDEISPELVLELWKLAGTKAGLGDGRPSAPNKPLPIPHGTFEVTSFTVVEGNEINDDVEIKFTPQAKAFFEKRSGGNGRATKSELSVPARPVTPTAEPAPTS